MKVGEAGEVSEAGGGGRETGGRRRRRAEG